MNVRAQSKYIKISASKVRDLAAEIRGKNALDSLALLKFSPRRGAKVLGKVLASAVANAENNSSLKKEGLLISEIFVDEGPKFKRYKPRARGAAGPIFRRSSHITIVVSGDEMVKKIKKNVEEPKDEMEIVKTDSSQGKESSKSTADSSQEKDQSEVLTKEQNNIKTKEQNEETKKEEKTVKPTSKKPNLKELAKDREKKQSKEEKKEKEKDFIVEKNTGGKEQDGFWNKYFRRKTG